MCVMREKKKSLKPVTEMLEKRFKIKKGPPDASN